MKNAMLLVTLISCLWFSPTSAAADEQMQENAQRVIVKLFGAGGGTLDSYGTGIVVSADGHVLTVASHLITTGGLTAVTADGSRFTATTQATSMQADAAIVKLNLAENQQLPFLDLATAADAVPGTPVLAFSNMFRVAAGSEPVSVVHGVIAATTPLNAVQGRWKFPLRTPVWILDAITNNSGAAGGLLTSQTGKPLGLIGREVRHEESRTWVNYAVPLKTLQPVVEELMQGKSTRLKNADETAAATLSDRQLTAQFGLTMMPSLLQRTPAYVDRVITGSAADEAGLQRGDLIVLIGDTVITDVREVGREMGAFRQGVKIPLTVDRSNQLINLQLTN
ncbi:MAG: S1C family serine protease [Planctomycetaceae bacterium]